MSGIIYGPLGQGVQVNQVGVGAGNPVVYNVPPVNNPVINSGVGIPVNNYVVNNQPQQGMPLGGQPMNVAQWEHMVCEILNYEVANQYLPRVNRINAVSEIAKKYGTGIVGCGQNRLVLNLGKVLNGVNEYVLKIASCNLGVMDNAGEYLLSVMMGERANDILAITEFQLGPLERYFKPINNREFHGRFIIQKKINGLGEIAQSMIQSEQGNGRTLSQIAKDLLVQREHERKNIIQTLSVSCFIFDMEDEKPFNYGIDPTDNKLKALDYGYVVPYSVFDLCCGVAEGTYTFTKKVNYGGMLVDKKGLKCSSSTCTGHGNGMLHYVEKEGVASYVCDCCGHSVSDTDLKGRLIKSWQ